MTSAVSSQALKLAYKTFETFYFSAIFKGKQMVLTQSFKFPQAGDDKSEVSKYNYRHQTLSQAH